MTPRICVSIGVPKVTETTPLIRKAESAGAELIEIRLDYLEKTAGLEKIVREAHVPLIATNRQYEQGGRKSQPDSKRVKDLLKVAAFGFSYVDIELTTPNVKQVTAELIRQKIKPIVSFHDLEKTPKTAELRKIVAIQIEAGAEVCKLVTRAERLNDNLTLLSLISETRASTNIVSFAMGNQGILSRVLSPMFGASFTYASLQDGMETASGQVSIQRLKNIYKSLGVPV